MVRAITVGGAVQRAVRFFAEARRAVDVVARTRLGFVIAAEAKLAIETGAGLVVEAAARAGRVAARSKASASAGPMFKISSLNLKSLSCKSSLGFSPDLIRGGAGEA